MKRKPSASPAGLRAALPMTVDELGRWEVSLASRARTGNQRHEVTLELAVYDDGDAGTPGADAAIFINCQRWKGDRQGISSEEGAHADLQIHTAELAPLISCLTRALELAKARGIIQ